MPKSVFMQMTFIGTAPALASADQDHIYILLDGPSGFWLIDCGGSAAHHLLKLGYDPLNLSGLILTHGHADHIYGLPVFIQDMWLRGRKHPLPIYANEPTMARSRKALELFMDRAQFNFLDFRLIPETPQNRALETPDFTLSTAPTIHSFPSLALRFDAKHSRRTLVYSADTAPCPNVVALARGAHILVHEATVLEPVSTEIGHSTPMEAATIASEAGVAELWLVHSNPALHQVGNPQLAETRKIFGNPVHVARDGDSVIF
jgi:ribonuclease Z